MKNMNAVFLDAEGLEELDLSGLREVCGSLAIYGNTSDGEVVSRIAGAGIIIVNKVRIRREHLEQSPDVKLIAMVATGVDCIDLEGCRELGVTVVNCRAYGTDSVVQHVFSLMLALTTGLTRYHDAVRHGRWQKAEQFCFLDYPIAELKGKKLGIVGYGTLGKGVARIAEAFGMSVVVAARPGTVDEERVQLRDLLPELDVLSLHCPLTEHTRGLIGQRELKAMKPTALLINCARGGIVDEAALAESLKNGEIGGAAVDTLSSEPPREGNPLLDSPLPNLIVTPHIAWASVEARQRILDQTAENIAAFQKGENLRVV